jgi:hypothetical protein
MKGAPVPSDADMSRIRLAFAQRTFKTAGMVSRPGLLLLSGVVLLAGCHTAKKVAVTSFRVVDAPARYVREQIDSTDTTTTTTTRTNDVVNPGYPVSAPTPATVPARTTVSRTATTTTPSRPATTGPKPTATPRPPVTETRQFPTARPVPNKPGYVYSLDPSGGIVDVTGYKAGDKAKDPYTQQVFIVP